MSALRASLRLTAYLLLTFSLMPVQGLALLVWPRATRKIPLFYHGLTLRCFGIRLQTVGIPERQHCLFVSNHTSFADIPVLGSLIEGCFVAKSDVASWPLFGLLAKLQRTVFIDRRRSRALGEKNKLAERLAQGDNLILFPEGTSSDGCRVLPFRAALFDSVLSGGADGCLVQPVTLTCLAENGLSAGRAGRERYAWYGDMTLVPSLFALSSRHHTTVRATFHPPISPTDFADRRALAKEAEQRIDQGLRY